MNNAAEMANSNLWEANWEGMLKRWSLEQGTRRKPTLDGELFAHPAMSDGTHLAPDPDPAPAPQWRGRAKIMFRKHPPPPGYDIADRVYDIACSFPVPKNETETEDEGESESEDEVKVEKQDESESESVSVSESESEDEDEVKVKKQSESESESEYEYECKSECEVKVKKQDESESEYEDEDESESEDGYEDEEELLDELHAYVESVDVARVLHIDNVLFPLLRSTLSNKHAASIRAKGAEVVTTMVQNYPTSQQYVIKEKGLHRLLRNFTTDPDATSRTKALGAISSLIRNNEPGVTAFRLANGYAALRDALSSESVSFQREVLKLIQYLLHENSSDCNIVTELGIPRIMMRLASNDDLEIRETALRGLLILARDEGGNSRQLVKNDHKLKRVLRKRIKGISAMAPEDLGAAREERQLVDSLWNACYNEPSSLGEKGLLVLPGEDAPAPDVASKLFEPPPRARAAEAANRNSISEKKEAPLLLGLSPPSAATPTVQSNSRPKRRKLHEFLGLVPPPSADATLTVQGPPYAATSTVQSKSRSKRRKLRQFLGLDPPPSAAATPTVQSNSRSKRKLH